MDNGTVALEVRRTSATVQVIQQMPRLLSIKIMYMFCGAMILAGMGTYILGEVWIMVLSFRTTENISVNSTALSSRPQIFAVGSNVYLAWTEAAAGNNEIFFRHSNDNGVSFGGGRPISKTPSVDGEYALFPRITSIGSNVYVVWQDKVSENYEIFLRESNDGGGRFSGIKNLSRNNTGDSVSPSIASLGNNVYVVWTDYNPGKSEVFLRASNDYASTFGGIKNISWSNGDSYDPKIALGGDSSVYVSWEDSSFREFTFDLIFRASDNSVDTFQNKVNVGRYVGEIADHSQIAGNGNNVFVVWSEAPRYSLSSNIQDIFRGK